jgi:hypothetical protein
LHVLQLRGLLQLLSCKRRRLEPLVDNDVVPQIGVRQIGTRYLSNEDAAGGDRADVLTWLEVRKPKMM